MSIVIPVTNEEAFFQQTTLLDGADFILRFRFNQRLCRWFMSVYDNEDSPVFVGIRLSTAHPLGRSVVNVDPRFPKGRLVVIDLEAETLQLARDACFRCFGVRQIVMYQEESEVT